MTWFAQYRWNRRLVCAMLFACGVVPVVFAYAFDPFGWGGGWSKDERAVLASLQLSKLEPAPSDRSNAVEGQASAAALGKRLFFDRRFSANGAVSCASCHDPAKQFQDGIPLGTGVAVGARRSMPVVNAGHSPFLFWDGRKDSVWAQALGPLEDPKEHGGNRLRFAHLLAEHYGADYQKVFGAMPDLDKLPANAGPFGSAAEQAAWQALAEPQRRLVSNVFANGGKALAAYQKTLSYGESRLDRFVKATLAGDARGANVLSDGEVRGLRLFINKAQCVTCHNGPLLTDHHFHNTGVAPRDPLHPDVGRMQAIAQVKADEFNCLGPYSAATDQCDELRFIASAEPAMLGAFRTPSLRNVALRPPYMHAGTLATLTDVVHHYATAPAAVAGRNERQPMQLSAREVADLVAFLGTLSGPVLENGKQAAAP